jgi:hypothetical protein
MSRQPAGPAAPWLSDVAIESAQAILRAHQQAFGRPLLAGVSSARCPRQAAQELFAASVVVLAHDGADPGGDPGPRLIYANRAALRLWRRPWAEMVGLPSRLTAEPAERADRARALAAVQQQRAISAYSGIRIDSQGRRFQIRRARLWNLGQQGAAGNRASGGQAAAFGDWNWL